jgi:5-methylcytosine-specific restriction endonuclease McrA
MKNPDHTLMMRRSANIFRHQVRRAKEAGQQLDYTLQELRAWANQYLHSPCPSCGERLTPANISVDHQVPVSREGGFHGANIRFMCLRCNQIKGALNAKEFDELTTLLHTWPSQAQQSVLRRLLAGGRFGHG